MVGTQLSSTPWDSLIQGVKQVLDQVWYHGRYSTKFYSLGLLGTKGIGGTPLSTDVEHGWNEDHQDAVEPLLPLGLLSRMPHRSRGYLTGQWSKWWPLGRSRSLETPKRIDEFVQQTRLFTVNWIDMFNWFLLEILLKYSANRNENSGSRFSVEKSDKITCYDIATVTVKLTRFFFVFSSCCLNIPPAITSSVQWMRMSIIHQWRSGQVCKSALMTDDR